MMTSSNGNFFRVTGPLCGEFTGDRWIHLTKASDAELWCLLWSAPEQTVEQTIETRSLWRHYIMKHFPRYPPFVKSTSQWWVPFPKGQWYSAFVIFFLLVRKKLLNKQLEGRVDWMPWHSCDISLKCFSLPACHGDWLLPQYMQYCCTPWYRAIHLDQFWKQMKT